MNGVSIGIITCFVV